METTQHRPDLIQRLESDLSEVLEELARVDDQGRKDYNLQNKANFLRASLEAAKKLFSKTDSGG